jgi:hypothetical protein
MHAGNSVIEEESRAWVNKFKDTFILPLLAAQTLQLQGLKGCQRRQRLNNSDQKQANNNK